MGDIEPQPQRGTQARALAAWLGRSEGAQLFEFALMLPFLLVAMIGVFDFGAGFHLKQKLTNAAREGARIATNQSTADLSASSCPATGALSPCSVEAVRNAVVSYLRNANVDASTLGTVPVKTGVREWTYYSTASGAPLLVINRSFSVPNPSGGIIVSTRVALNYPFTWSFGNVIRLLVPSATGAGTVTISSQSIMKNLG